jgi:hypothetical protein
MPSDDGGPAFPNGSDGTMGMSLRQWYAGRALEGILAGVLLSEMSSACARLGRPDDLRPAIARCAFDFADAMIAAGEVK